MRQVRALIVGTVKDLPIMVQCTYDDRYLLRARSVPRSVPSLGPNHSARACELSLDLCVHYVLSMAHAMCMP